MTRPPVTGEPSCDRTRPAMPGSASGCAPRGTASDVARKTASRMRAATPRDYACRDDRAIREIDPMRVTRESGRRSLLAAKRLNRIDFLRAARRLPRGNHGQRQQRGGRRDESWRVQRLHAVKQSPNQLRADRSQ